MSTFDNSVVGRLGRVVTHGCQATLVGLTAAAVVQLSVARAINFGLPLAFALTPTVLRRRYGYPVRPGLGLLVALSATLHAVGALGVYQSVPWYDQVAHTVSAAVVAGVGYAVLDAIDRYDDGIVIPPRLHVVFLFVFATAFGVCWEIGEFAAEGVATTFGGEPLLAQYGLQDIVLDLSFNAVGAIVVAAFGTGLFSDLTRILAGVVDW